MVEVAVASSSWMVSVSRWWLLLGGLERLGELLRTRRDLPSPGCGSSRAGLSVDSRLLLELVVAAGEEFVVGRDDRGLTAAVDEGAEGAVLASLLGVH
jgi:hypothetical protein